MGKQGKGEPNTEGTFPSKKKERKEDTKIILARYTANLHIT